MNPDEIAIKKKLLDENCAQLAAIMEEYKHGSKEYALISQVMGPMVDHVIELKDSIFSDLKPTISAENKEKLNDL